MEQVCVCHRPQLGKAMSKHNEVIVKHQYSSQDLAITDRNTSESSVNWIPGDRQKRLQEKSVCLPNCVCPVRTTSYHLSLNKLFKTTAVDSEVGLHTSGVGLISEC